MELTRRIRVCVGVILFFSAVMVCLSGCKTSKDSGYKLLVDDFAEIMLAQDRDSGAYDQALTAVSGYLKTQSREDLETAREAVEEAIGQMTEDLKGITSREISREMTEILKSCDMDPEEYKVNADMRAVRLSDYVSKLTNLKGRLDLAAAAAGSDGRAGESGVQAELTRILNFWVSYYTRYQNYMRTYSYYTINYWFCSWDQEKTAYVEERLLNRLESFKTEESFWEQSRESVVRKMDLCMDGIEELGHELESYMGAAQAELHEQNAGKSHGN